MINIERTRFFIKRWRFFHWLFIFLTFFISFFVVVKRNNFRNETISIKKNENIASKIDFYEQEIMSLHNLSEVSSIQEHWVFMRVLVDKYKLKLNFNGKDTPLYQGPLLSWSANISGYTPLVLSAMKEVQKNVPAYLYGIKINGVNTSIDFSIIGGEGSDYKK